MLTFFFEFVGIHASASGKIAVEQTVHHHIGIAAYRRCEVGVVLERQSVVTHIHGAIHCLCHRADGKCGYQLFLGTALDVAKQLIERTIHLVHRTRNLEFVSESHSYVGKVLHLLWVGRFVHAINKCLGSTLLGHYAYGFCHLTVGK